MDEEEIEYLFGCLSVLVNDIKEQFRHSTLEEKCNSIDELEDMLTLLLLMEDSLQCDDDGESSHVLTQSVVELLRCSNAILEEAAVRPRGRPVLPITDEDLLLMYHDFTLTDMSRVLNCLTRTIQRRLHSIGMSRQGIYGDISDSELERVAEIQQNHPDRGFVFVEGTFNSLGAIS